MAAPNDVQYPPGKHRYRTVTDGMAMAQSFLRSGLGISAFARQFGVSARMVKYWSSRAQMLASASEVAAAPSPPLLEHVASVDDEAIHSLPPPASPPPDPLPLEAPATGRIDIILPSGTKLVVSGGVSPELLRQVVQCLMGGQC